MVENAHVYKSIPGQIIGKTSQGILVKTGDTMLEIIEYTYSGKVKVGDRLKDHE